MKRFKKNKFKFINKEGDKILGKEGDIYFRREWTLNRKFPFLFYENKVYELSGGYWVIHE
jgi:hypothetical protein